MTDILCPTCRTPMTGEFMCCQHCSTGGPYSLGQTEPKLKPPLDPKDQQIHDLRVLLAEKEAIIRKLEKPANSVAKVTAAPVEEPVHVERDMPTVDRFGGAIGPDMEWDPTARTPDGDFTKWTDYLILWSHLQDLRARYEALQERFKQEIKCPATWILEARALREDKEFLDRINVELRTKLADIRKVLDP